MNLEYNDTSTCRSCLLQGRFMMSVFNSFNNFVLAKIIEDLTALPIIENDVLPKFICHDCTIKFIEAYQMREMYIKSDLSFRENLEVEKAKIESGGDFAVSSSDVLTYLNELLPNEKVSNEIRNVSDIEITEEVFGTFDLHGAIPEEDQKQIEVELTEVNAVENPAGDIITSDEDCPDITNSDTSIFACSKCDKQFTTKVSLNRHMNYHQMKKTKCPLCAKEFSHKSNLKRHILIHKNRKPPYPCEMCKKKFNILAALYEHAKTHNYADMSKNDDYVIHCELCEMTTSSLATFYTHMKDKHDVQQAEVKPFKCEMCYMRFTSKQAMYRHIDNIHENNRRNLRNRDRNFLCTECGKSFYTNFHLEIHMRAHTGERPFKCPVANCGKSFSQQSGYKMHSYIHTKERPYSCDICGKKFTQHGHVKEHMMTHSEARPHVCNICNHSFRIKGNLTAHMLTHTGKKEYNCTSCGKRFLQSTKLRMHLQKFHQHPSSNYDVNTIKTD